MVRVTDSSHPFGTAETLQTDNEKDRKRNFCRVNLSNAKDEATKTQGAFFETEHFVQHHVRDRVASLKIHATGSVEALLEQGRTVKVDSRLFPWPLFASCAEAETYVEQFTYTLTQQDDGSFVIKTTVKGVGGGDTPPTGSTSEKTEEKGSKSTSKREVHRKCTETDCALLSGFIDACKTTKNKYLLRQEMQNAINKRGANINLVYGEGITLFSTAMSHNQLPCLELLLELNADVNLVSKSGPPLYQAVLTNLSFCSALLDYDADVEEAEAYAIGRGQDLLRLAIKCCSDLNRQDAQVVLRLMEKLNVKVSQELLNLAVQLGKTSLIDLFLKQGNCCVTLEHFSLFRGNKTYELLTSHYKGEIIPLILALLRKGSFNEAIPLINQSKTLNSTDGLLEAALSNEELLKKQNLAVCTALIEKGALLSDLSTLTKLLSKSPPKYCGIVDRLAVLILEKGLSPDLPINLNELLKIALHKTYWHVAESLLLKGGDVSLVPLRDMHHLATPRLLGEVWSKSEDYIKYLDSLCQEMGLSKESEAYPHFLSAFKQSPLPAAYFRQAKLRAEFIAFIKEQTSLEPSKLEAALKLWQETLRFKQKKNETMRASTGKISLRKQIESSKSIATKSRTQESLSSSKNTSQKDLPSTSD